jgi:hypothetical protein
VAERRQEFVLQQALPLRLIARRSRILEQPFAFERGLLVRRHVPADADHPVFALAVILHHPSALHDPNRPAVRAHQPVLGFVQPMGERGGKRLVDAGAILLVSDACEPQLRTEGAFGKSEERLRIGGPRELPGREVPLPRCGPCDRQRKPEALFVLPHPLVGPQQGMRPLLDPALQLLVGDLQRRLGATSFSTMLFATTFNRVSSSSVSSLPVNTTMGTSRRALFL